MPSALRTLILKELKELLRDPKVLIGMVLMPVLILPLMGGALDISQEAVAKELAHASIGVWDRDHSAASSTLIAFLRPPNLNQTVIPISAANEVEAAANLLATNTTVLLEIPAGYGANISRGVRGLLHVFVAIKSMGLAESSKGSLAGQVIDTYGYYLSLQKIESLLEQANITGVNPTAVYSPLSVEYSSVIKGNIVDVPPQSILGVMLSQGIMLPLVSIMLLTFAMQIAATSIAVEKEEKTLETLMTLPVSRLTILTGKLAGSIIVAVAGAVAYIIGFGYYMNSAFGFAGSEAFNMNLSSLGLALNLQGLVLLGITIFVTLVSGLALALSIAVFTDSVRSAQSLVGVIYLPAMIPMIVLMFVDIQMLPLPFQIVLYAVPYTHTILASQAIFMGNYSTVFTSILYISLFTVIVLYVAAKIFTSERVITARISPRKFSLRWRRGPT
jgi:ABC-2 type transport system permease protein